jgi:hypothetical protein
MTTEADIITGIELPQMQLHTFITQHMISEISPLVDFDELIFDFQNVIGDGSYGTVFRGTVCIDYKFILVKFRWSKNKTECYFIVSIVDKKSPLKFLKFKKCHKKYLKSLNAKLI